VILTRVYLQANSPKRAIGRKIVSYERTLVSPHNVEVSEFIKVRSPVSSLLFHFYLDG